MHSINRIHKSLASLLFVANCLLLSNAKANIEYLYIFKEQIFQQDGNSAPEAPLFWFFNAGVSGDSQVTGGTVVYPGSDGPVTLTTGGEGKYSTDSLDYTSQAAMDAVFPNGQVSLSIDDNGSTSNFGSFNLTGDNYPPAPHFLNLLELQSADSSQDFPVQWDPFTGAGPDDKIIFQIFEPELEQEVMFLIIDATASGIEIPGGSLSDVFSYDMHLFFLKATDTLTSPESIIGYISSNYTIFTPGSESEYVTIADEALRQAIKLELDLFPEDNITYAGLSEISALTVESDDTLDLTGLEYAISLNSLTLYAGNISNFLAIAYLESLEEVKLVAPQKEGLFFTHWSDGSQENPRILGITWIEDFGLQAEYSTVPLSPFAGGYSLIVNGLVSGTSNLPNPLEVELGDPFELRLNYLIKEEAIIRAVDSSLVTMDYQGSGFLPGIAMEAELRIGAFRWILRTTAVGVDQASMAAISDGTSSTFQFALFDSDHRTEYDFPYSNGLEQLIFEINSNQTQGDLFNRPLDIPNSPDFINWEAITSGSFGIVSLAPNEFGRWEIQLSFLPGPNQSYRIEKLPSYLDLTRSIVGYSTDRPTANVERSTEFLEIYWNDPYYQNFETTYEVWRGTSNNRSSASMVATDLLEPVFSDSDVLPGRNYFYWIRAIRDGLKADFSLPVTNFRAVAYPEDIQATQGDFADRIRVSWTRASGATSYSLYRSTTEDYDNGEIIQEGITGTEYEDFSPDSDDPYYYWGTSTAFDVSSDYGNVASGYRVANGITTVRATDGLYTDRVRVNWDAFPGATAYTVYRNAANDSASASTLAIGLTNPGYDDLVGSENQGVTFYYWVRPFIGGQIGSFSNTDPGYIPLQTATNILAWGDNDFDQTNIPLGNLTDVVEIAAGANHSLALSSTGTVVGWGRNEYGQATTPQGLTDVIDIAVGYDHSLALKRNGTVVAWGRNNFGKTNPPNGLANVIDIEAGADHSLALLADGSVVGWGGNDYGQVDIPETLTQVVQISAGGFHNMARRADGTVVTWGDNSLGQRDIPSRITKVIDISAGWNHSLVLLPGGFVDGWGDNSRGQLNFPGDVQGPLQAKGVIIRDPVTASIVDISGGLFHSLALSAKGELSAWGEDKNSQTKSPESLGVISQIDAGDEFNLVVGKSALPKIESLIPNNTNLLSGEDIILRVRATGGPDISYQWLFNNLPVESATSDTLLLGNVSPDDKGSYSVKVLSGGNEVSSDPIQIEVTVNQATVGSQTVRAIRAYDGTYLFSPVETNPPGLTLAIRSSEGMKLPSTTGTHMVSIDVAQKGYAAPSVENVTLILDALDDQHLSLLASDTGLSILYLAPEGFKSILQTSSDLREWIILAKVASGDGLFHDFNVPSPAENFYRVVFEVP